MDNIDYDFSDLISAYKKLDISDSDVIYLRNPELFDSDKDFRGYLFMESRNYPSCLCSE